MKHPVTRCQPAQLERFLRQELTPSEMADLELHLTDCQACQLSLESGTATADTWQLVRESLSSAEIPAFSPTQPEVVPTGSVGQDSMGEDSLGQDSPGHDAVDQDEDIADDSPFRWDSLLRFLSPTDDPRMLGRLGAYEIVGIVGHGGMGIVLKGLDPALNRYVAIKVLAPHLAASGSARQRFAREAQAAAAVTHENVIAIHGVAAWNGMPYLVMPYLRGESLQKRIDLKGPLSTIEVLRVGRQIAAGLAAAHAQGVVHRDIKPANILLEDGVDRLQITDFGLARSVDDASLTRSGVIAGTPQYMSPEQARGDLIDERSDQFSLGSTLYTACTGRPPFRGETSYGILRKITDSAARHIAEINPEIPDWLAAIIARLMAKAPHQRFPNATHVTRLLEQCLAHVRQPTVLPLPDEIRALVLQDRAQMPPVWAQIWNRLPFSDWRIATGFITVLIIAWGAWSLNWTSPQHSPTTVADSETAASSVQPAVTAPRMVVVEADWDTDLSRLGELQRAAEELKQHSDQFWNVVPQPDTGLNLQDAPDLERSPEELP